MEEDGDETRPARLQEQVEYAGGVQYRRVSVWFDLWLCRILKRLHRLAGAADPRRPLLSSPLYYLGYALRVAHDLRRQQCDLVHIHNFSQFVAIIRAFNPQTKIVLHMHCEWLSEFEQNMIGRRLRRVDWVIGCSEHVTQGIGRAFPHLASRCLTIHNGVDVDHFARGNGHHQVGKDGHDHRVLYVGRISPEKGLHVLLDAFQVVLARHPKARLEVMGPEYRKPFRESYLEQLKGRLSPGLARRAHFFGFVEHAELVGFYRNATLFVSPSLSEAFGMTLVEAMAMEVPVVATRTGGMIEVVEDGKSGLLVEPNNAMALADAMIRLLSDKNLRASMGQAGRRRAVERFSWQRVSENLLRAYGVMCEAR